MAVVTECVMVVLLLSGQGSHYGATTIQSARSAPMASSIWANAAIASRRCQCHSGSHKMIITKIIKTTFKKCQYQTQN